MDIIIIMPWFRLLLFSTLRLIFIFIIAFDAITISYAITLRFRYFHYYATLSLTLADAMPLLRCDDADITIYHYHYYYYAAITRAIDIIDTLFIFIDAADAIIAIITPLLRRRHYYLFCRHAAACCRAMLFSLHYFHYAFIVLRCYAASACAPLRYYVMLFSLFIITYFVIFATMPAPAGAITLFYAATLIRCDICITPTLLRRLFADIIMPLIHYADSCRRHGY